MEKDFYPHQWPIKPLRIVLELNPFLGIQWAVAYNPSYKWINPTSPIYNWGYNPLTKWVVRHQVDTDSQKNWIQMLHLEIRNWRRMQKLQLVVIRDLRRFSVYIYIYVYIYIVDHTSLRYS